MVPVYPGVDDSYGNPFPVASFQRLIKPYWVSQYWRARIESPAGGLALAEGLGLAGGLALFLARELAEGLTLGLAVLVAAGLGLAEGLTAPAG